MYGEQWRAYAFLYHGLKGQCWYTLSITCNSKCSIKMAAAYDLALTLWFDNIAIPSNVSLPGKPPEGWVSE